MLAATTSGGATVTKRRCAGGRLAWRSRGVIGGFFWKHCHAWRRGLVGIAGDHNVLVITVRHAAA